MKKIKNTDKIAVGIDFGTTNSLIAVKINNENVIIIPNNNDEVLLKSVVEFSRKNGWSVGGNTQDNKDQVLQIASVKRLLGGLSLRNPNQIKNKTTSQFKDLNIKHLDNEIFIELEKDLYISVTEIIEKILQELKNNAESYLGININDVVITVPAHFEENARSKIKKAAENVGFKVLRLLNEPTAAAIAYGIDRNPDSLFAVYDMGGGTFDVSLMKIEDGVLQVIATGGDRFLGGDDFDFAIAEKIKTLKENESLNFKEILKKAKKIKESILSEDLSFDSIFDPLISRSIEILHKVCADVMVSVEDLNLILLVGGNVKLYSIQRAIKQISKEGAVLLSDEPELMVVIGAAKQAYNIKYPDFNYYVLLDVVPMTLGIETVGGIVEPIIFRNTSIPCEAIMYFTTYIDDQEAFVMRIFQGESIYADQCLLVGEFELNGLVKMKAGEARLAVRFFIDANGLLTIDAKEEVSDIKANVSINFK